MKCPKCGYVSHDYLNACRKCSVDLMAFKAQMQLYVVQTGSVDLRTVVGDVKPSPMTSGEFEMGESLFDSPMLVEAQGEDGFDISLEDDFSFTPSAMSLESLDGFELSNVDSMNPEHRRSADPSPPEAEAADRPDTGYATVMMDIGGLNNEEPPIEPSGVMFDEPIESAGPTFGPPPDSAEAVIEFPDLPADDVFVEPDLTSAELRSSVGRTSDLDLTSMELKRTTRDIEMLEQIKNEALSGEIAPPAFDAPAANEGADWSSAETVVPDLYQSGEEEEPAAFAPEPEAFAPEPDDADDAEGMDEGSGNLVMPSMDTTFINAQAALEYNTADDRASDAGEDDFDLPELPELDLDEKPVANNPFTEEISLAIDPEALSDTPPMDFPSLQTGVYATPPPEETTLIDEQQAASPPVQPAAADASETEFATTELELGHPDAPKPADAFVTATPEETTLADEQPPPLPAEPAASSDTGYATIELDITESYISGDAPLITDLPEPAEAAPSPEEVTLVDEPSPFTPAEPALTGSNPASPNTDPTTIEIDIGDTQLVDDEPAFPDLPQDTDALLIPSPEEATLVDEQPPPLPTRHTPVDFTVAPPDTGYATIELDISGAQLPDDTPAFPDLPADMDASRPPSPEEATIVDEPSPFFPAGHAPDGPEAAQPDTNELEDELEDELDIELMFPDDQQSGTRTSDTDGEPSP